MKHIFFLLLTTLLFSCKTNQTISTVVAEPQIIPFVELSVGLNGDFSEKINKIITNQNEYNAAWNAAFSRFSDQPKPAKIDFENQLILLVTMGEKNSGGYSIKIDSIVENEKTIVVTILETSPGKSCITTSMMTYPYQMVELKNSTKEVIFKTIEKFYDCK
ncbi:MAG: hypothetical protein A3K10_17795 [Bacteroidetes bacterium RIFCSPLOWO2_12_FULL_31_6]|nr:MAG: hypothetical protein A3K10_17795 [Bacteroidetes bacterium RIFCSPLOWO2_12_FULL_31_6]